MTGHRVNEQTHSRRAVAVVLMVALLTLCGSSFADASTPAINQAAADAQALSNLVDQLSGELEAAAEDYDYANQQLKDTQAAVKKTSAEMAQAENDLAAAQDQFGQRLVAMYEAGDLSFLSVILDANSFSDLINGVDQLTRMSEQDAQLVKQIQAYKVQAANRKSALDSQLQQQEALKAQTAAAKQKVLSQLTKQNNALKGKEAQLAQLKKAEAARQAKLVAEAKARAAFLASRPGKVISLALQYLGVPYVWGGTSPSGFDCSGLVQYVYAKVGVSLSHSSQMQYGCGTPVAQSQLRAGDLVFFGNPTIHHVGIYIGNGEMINATGTHVQISTVWRSGYHGACRVL